MNPIDMPVEEFTTPFPVTAKESASIDELRELMKRHEIRHLPIVTGETVVGIVSDRDLKLAAGLTRDEKRQVFARDIMSPEPITVSSNDSLCDVAFEMSEKKIGSVIVNDETDKMIGIFTVTDALNALVEVIRAEASPR